MIHPLTTQAERLPDKLAVVDDRPDGITLAGSYAELNRRANRLAHVFRDLGLRPGERLPKTGSGKVLKRSLREPFWQGRTRRVG